MSYAAYLSQERPKNGYYHDPDVIDMTYPDFTGSRTKNVIGALIEMFNSLNIISVCFNQDIYMGYQASLRALQSKMRALLDQLVFGVTVRKGKFCCLDYRWMIFGHCDDNWINDNEVDRLAQYYNQFSRNSLATQVFTQQRNDVKRDYNLFAAVTDVLNYLEDIDHLLSRGTELEAGSILDTESIKMLSDCVFPEKQERLPMPTI